jgi:hypothetical protein
MEDEEKGMSALSLNCNATPIGYLHFGSLITQQFLSLTQENIILAAGIDWRSKAQHWLAHGLSTSSELIATFLNIHVDAMQHTPRLQNLYPVYIQETTLFCQLIQSMHLSIGNWALWRGGKLPIFCKGL